MTSYYTKGSSVGAAITSTDPGGFVAVASNGDVDRDGEVIAPGCFAPLPASIPIHLDHTMSAASVVARGVPYYEGDRLMVRATFAATSDAQAVRTKVRDGTLDSVSIVFRGTKWRDVRGVRTCVEGELLAADIVSVPANPGARILSMRGLSRYDRYGRDLRGDMNTVIADALVALARAEIAACKAVDTRGPMRARVDRELRSALNPGAIGAYVERELSSILNQ